MADFLKSIDSKSMANIDEEQLAAAGISSAGLKKQLKKLTKGSPALQKPLSAVKQQRMERTVNYTKNKKEASKWVAQIKLNRKLDQVDFTQERNKTKGATIASMAANYEAKDSTEKAIEQALIKDGQATDKQIMEKEKQDLFKLEPQEMRARIQQMSKLKFLLFNQEIKNKRIKKIKSKLYHKIKRKAKEKDEKKLISELEEIDPEAAKLYQEKTEQKRLEERISLRHGTHSKFAKNLKRYGTFDNEEHKQAYFELIRQRDELMKKTKKISNPTGNDSDSDLDSDESMDNPTSALNDIEKMKADAIAKITQIMSDDSEESDGEGEDGFDEDKLAKKNKPKAKKTGIMGMKFMLKHEKASKAMNYQNNKNKLIDEIKNYEDEQSESEEDQEVVSEKSDAEDLDEIQLEQSDQEGEGDNLDDNKPTTKTSKNKVSGGKQKFKGEIANTYIPANVTLATEDVKDILKKSNKKVPQAKSGKKDHIDKMLENTENITSEDLVKQWQGSVNKVSGKKRANGGVTFDLKSDMKDFNIDQIKSSRKRIKIDEIDKEDQDLRKIYVTNEEMEKEEFEKQKEDIIDQQMEDELKSKDKNDPKNMEGWGDWAGEGVTKSRAQVEKETKRRQRKIDEIKKKRLDGKKANVIINESRDKNFTKYLVDKLPHPFKNAGQFEQLMKTPIGKEWNSLSAYKKLIQPDILVKAGKIIKPLQHRKDISLSTVEKLIEKRKGVDAPAAKF
jgi:U3 small nucleolar RNA-associated protein 14